MSPPTNSEWDDGLQHRWGKDQVISNLDQLVFEQQPLQHFLSLGAALTALREKDAILDKLVKDADAERRDLVRELQLLRERIAKLEGHAERKSAP